MKDQLLKTTLMLTTAFAATLFTGCASMNRGYSSVSEPVNTLAYTAPTDPVQLSKWTGDRFLQLGMRSQDLYYFQVPDTGYNPAPADYSYQTPNPSSSRDLNSAGMTSSEFNHRESIGAPGPYESGSGGSKVIRHQPGSAR